MQERFHEILKKAREYVLHGIAILLAIIFAPAGLLTLLMVALIDILHEIADED